MNFHGDIGDGEFGQLSHGQLVEWVEAKIEKGSGRGVNRANVAQCCTYAMDHGGAGGGGTRFTWKGHVVYHVSHGQRGGGNGCTLFFAHMGGGNGVIVAVGSHRGETSYDLDWSKSGWHSGVLEL